MSGGVNKHPRPPLALAGGFLELHPLPFDGGLNFGKLRFQNAGQHQNAIKLHARDEAVRVGD
jgi:hypothetical protein